MCCENPVDYIDHPLFQMAEYKCIFDPKLHEKLQNALKVVDSCWTFSTELSDTFRSCFVYGKEQESRKKIIS